jgi:hypothetical protein
MKTSSKDAAVKPQELKAPKTVLLTTHLQSLAIIFLATASLGLIGGYFVSINVHADARQAVVQDMSIVSKSVEQ